MARRRPVKNTCIQKIRMKTREKRRGPFFSLHQQQDVVVWKNIPNEVRKGMKSFGTFACCYLSIAPNLLFLLFSVRERERVNVSQTFQLKMALSHSLCRSWLCDKSIPRLDEKALVSIDDNESESSAMFDMVCKLSCDFGHNQLNQTQYNAMWHTFALLFSPQ